MMIRAAPAILFACIAALIALPAQADVVRLSTGAYAGASSDEKPTTDIARTARFLETDTGRVYLWDGSSWVQWGDSVFLGNTLAGEDLSLNRTFGGPKGLCKVMSADGVIKASAGMLISVYISKAEANDDFVIYDNASAASGTQVFNQTDVGAGDHKFDNVPASVANGLYLDVTAADGSIAFTVTVCYL